MGFPALWVRRRSFVVSGFSPYANGTRAKIPEMDSSTRCSGFPGHRAFSYGMNAALQAAAHDSQPDSGSEARLLDLPACDFRKKVKLPPLVRRSIFSTGPIGIHSLEEPYHTAGADVPRKIAGFSFILFDSSLVLDSVSMEWSAVMPGAPAFQPAQPLRPSLGNERLGFGVRRQVVMDGGARQPAGGCPVF